MDDKAPCLHEWKKSKQMIQPQDRTEKQITQGMEFAGSKAYFIVKECTKCKVKQYLDYKVEGIHE